MSKIKKFDSFNKKMSKVNTYLNDLIKKGGKIASDTWEATKVEGKETKIAIGILSRMVRGEEISNNEKKFLKAQSMDIVKILPLVFISGIPIPIPITPLLIVLGKKYGFDFLPKDHRGMLEDDDES